MGNELLAQCQGYTCLQILNAIFAFTPIYLIFLLFGVFSVLLFSSQMMRQPTYLSSESNDPIALFPPQYLTFRAKYRLASVSYAVLLVLIYLIFTLIMDQPGIDLPQLGNVKAASTPAKELMVDGVRWQIKYLDPTVPLLLALMLIGVLPRFALIESYEKRLREWVHEIFLIPTLGRTTADRIENAPVNRIENAPVDFMARLAPQLTPAEDEAAGPLLPPRTYETLLRLSIITSVPETLKAVPSAARFFDSAHLAAYGPRFAAAQTLADSFCAHIKAATALVNGIASPAAGVALLTDRLKAEHQTLKGEMRFLSLVLAGAILRRTGSEDQINRALAAVGLEASPSNVETTAGDTAIYISIWVAIAFWVWSVVVDGASSGVGSAGGLRRLVERATAAPKAALEVKVAAASPGLEVTVRAPPGVSGRLSLALSEAELSSKVERGENAGRTLVHAPVARLVVDQGAISPEQKVRLGLSKSWRRDRLRVVAFVQDPRGRVIALGTAAVN